MIKVILTVGIPGSGKSTWSKQEIAKDPNNWVRISNDDLRSMMNGSVWSADYEKIIGDARLYLLRDALKRGKNVILDNLNINKRNWADACKIAKEVNIDAMVMEKVFYVELEEAIARDSQRTGTARVGESVIKKWFKESGGKQFAFYKPKVEVFQERKGSDGTVVEAPAFVPGVSEVILCDLDGSLALIHNRSPYDASDCDIKDLPNIPVVETVLAHYKAGRKIIFVSGREDKYRPETVRFIEKHCLRPARHTIDHEVIPPEPIEYQLHMRKSGDFRKDSIVKEEIYQEHIEGKYNVLCVLDDRRQVVEFWRSKGLTCFQVAPGDF